MCFFTPQPLLDSPPIKRVREPPVRDRFVSVRAALAWMAACSPVLALAQTTVNNTVINNNSTMNIVVQRQTVIVQSAAPAYRPPPPPPPPPNFPYQPRELLPYMSSRCAQLYEIEISGVPRRTSYSTVAGVRNEFQSDCPDAVSDARKRLNTDKAAKYYASQDQKMAANNAAQQSRMTQEQCNELLRILAGKRKRLATMTEGEKADHARSEDNYTARCKSN